MDSIRYAKRHKLVYIPISTGISIKYCIYIIVGISHFILSIGTCISPKGVLITIYIISCSNF